MTSGRAPLLALIPAAGLSRRMGSSKPLLPLGHTDFIGTLVAALRHPRIPVERIVVVHRAEDHALAMRLERLASSASPGEAGLCAVALQPPVGDMLFSIRAGWRALGEGPGALVWPVDAPLVALSTVEAVVTMAREEPSRVVRPVHQDRPGHPVWVPCGLLNRSVDPQKSPGLRGLIGEAVPGPLEVPVEDPTCLVNINTPEAYATWCEGAFPSRRE